MICLRILISLLLIIILLYIMRGKYSDIISALKNVNIFIFFLAFAAFLLAISSASLRLELIVKAQKIPITFKDAVYLTFIGYFFNNFLPTSIGGDVVKAYYLSKKIHKKTPAFTAVFVDRAIGLFTMIFMAFLALVFARPEVVDSTVKNMIYIITIISIASIIFIANKNIAKKISKIMFFIRPIESKLKDAYNSIHHYKNHNLLLAQSLGISIVSQLFFFATIGILALGIHSAISPMNILLRVPIISAMSLLPSINGLGLREGAMVLMFGPLIGSEKAFAVSILWLAVLLLTSILGGILYAASPKFKIKLKELKSAEIN